MAPKCTLLIIGFCLLTLCFARAEVQATAPTVAQGHAQTQPPARTKPLAHGQEQTQALAAAPSLATGQTQTSVVLRPGLSKTLPAPDQATVQIDDGKIIKVVDLGQSVSIVARQIGETQVHINQKTYTFKVVSKKTFHLYGRLQRHFQAFAQVNPTIIDDRVYLFGKNFGPSALSRLMKIPVNKGQWTLAVRPRNATAADQLQTQFNKALQNWNLPAAKIRFAATTQVLVDEQNLAFKKLYTETLKPFGIDVAVLPKMQKPQQMVKLRLAIAEVKKGHLQKIGLKWPTQLQAEVLPKLEWQSGNEASLFQLDLLESQGHGKILASPNLLCESGKEAEFMAGGEIPIPSGFGHDVIWKKHGILLKIKPLIYDQSKIQIHLTTEISSLDFANSINGIPGIASNSLSTVFNLDRPYPIILSGLMKNENGKQTDGMPLLSRVPIIGPLFSSRSYYQNKTELVIVVLPKIVDQSEPANFQFEPVGGPAAFKEALSLDGVLTENASTNSGSTFGNSTYGNSTDGVSTDAGL